MREISYEAPVNGMDVQLSIDLDLQQYAERLLQTQLRQRRGVTAGNPEVTKPDGQRGPLDPSLPVGAQVHYEAPAGSVIVMDQHSGQVAAMASYPTFDNRWFSADIDSAKFAELFPLGEDADPDRAPLANRAIQGQYNLGSTFKPFVAHAALATGLTSAGTYYNDQGTYKVRSISDDVCATGVRCEYRNSICSHTGKPCIYGSVNYVVVARRLERRLLLQAR